MQGELNFDDILDGKDPVPNKPVAKETIKLSQTETRKRQQSCMAKDVDKDLLPSNINKNPQNFRVSLLDMLNIDKQDESLERYKKALLGTVKEENLKEDEPAEVEIIKVEILSKDRPKGPIVLDFRQGAKHVHEFTIKQGQIYHLRVFFLVRNDIVYGLKFANNVYKMLAKVDKDEDKMGCFAPQEKPHVFDLPLTEAPKGFLARGGYKGKGLFVDTDGIVHMQFDYLMNIASEW